jgi:hypothetical protein
MHDNKLMMAKKYTSFAGNFDDHSNVPVRYGVHRLTWQV